MKIITISQRRNDTLQKTNIVSKTLQQAGICTIVKLCVTRIQDQFDDFGRKAKMLVSVGYAETRVRKRRRKLIKRDGPGVEFNRAKD